MMQAIYLLCGISRQGHIQAIKRQAAQVEQSTIYIRLMEQVRDIHPGMGLRTMYDMLEPEGIGRDAFIVLGLQEGFRLKAIENKTRTTCSIKTNRYKNLLCDKEFTDINQLWSSDITYWYILEKFYYLIFIMDVYSRRIIGYSVADNMKAENNYKALKMALTLRGINDYQYKLIHHSDKGSQYVSELYTETLHDYHINISMCNEVYENTHIERVNDTIKNQYLNRMQISNYKQIEQIVKQVITTYNEKRPHQSLHKKTPCQYEAYVLSTNQKNRQKMKIFTSDLSQKMAQNKQVKLFNN